MSNCVHWSLDHLKQTMFDSAAAIVFGLFMNSEPANLLALMFRLFKASVPFPVFHVNKIVHSFVNNTLWLLNTNVTIVSRQTTNRHDVSCTLTVYNIYIDKMTITTTITSPIGHE